MVGRPAMAPVEGPGAVAGSAAEEMRWRQLDSGVSAVSFGFVATAILVSMFLAMAILEHFLRAPARVPGMGGMGEPPAPPRGGILSRLRLLLRRGGGGGEAGGHGADLEAARKLDGRASPEKEDKGLWNREGNLADSGKQTRTHPCLQPHQGLIPQPPVPGVVIIDCSLRIISNVEHLVIKMDQQQNLVRVVMGHIIGIKSVELDVRGVLKYKYKCCPSPRTETLLLQLLAHHYQLTARNWPEDGSINLILKSVACLCQMPVYAKGVSVLMPGHDVPTFIAHPAPAPCPPERIRWPSHQPTPFAGSSSNPC